MKNTRPFETPTQMTRCLIQLDKNMYKLILHRTKIRVECLCGLKQHVEIYVSI